MEQLRKATPTTRISKSEPTSPVSGAPRIWTTQRVSADPIAKYCCYLRGPEARHGSGFIVELEDLQNANLLALDAKSEREKLQTNYALITSHNTIPGSPMSLSKWEVSCQGINNGNELTLSNLVCRVISCCGSKSLFDIRHGDENVVPEHVHPNRICKVDLNVTILFLNSTFGNLCMLQGCTVLPPGISVEKYLNQDAFSQEYEKIFSFVSSDRGKDQSESSSTPSVGVYYCSEPRSSSKTTAVTIAVCEQQDTPQHYSELNHDIAKFEKLQKLYYRELNSAKPVLDRKYYGSPVVYHNPDTNEESIIGVHVGETDQKGEYVAVTFHGMLQILRGGLIPVLSVLNCLKAPRAWPSRWAYLVTPHIDLKSMKYGYVCEVLYFLLRPRFGCPLIDLPVHLKDVDNEASLDLLCALFKHLEKADEADLNKVITKSYDESDTMQLDDAIKSYDESDTMRLDDAIKEKLCKKLLHLLASATKDRDQKISPTTEAVELPAMRKSLVEKCCTFYNGLLNIKFAGITQVLCTFENLELLQSVLQDQRYKSAEIQKTIIDIYGKFFPILKEGHLATASGRRKHSLRGIEQGAVKKRCIDSDDLEMQEQAEILEYVRSAQLAGERRRSEGKEHLDINNLADITHYLHQLDKTTVINLGLVLGLDYNRLKTMMDSQTFLQDMLAGWLQRVDRVLEIGVPTWRGLAEALRDPRVGQNGVASKIEQNSQQ